jgi:NAD(P)-dependent dehydrogenase (short-subunit alcohol dehydrogenase family)
VNLQKKLSGRTAVITGANQGLGLAIAEEFVRQGANLLICARDTHKLEAAQQTLSLITEGDQEVIAHPADVSSEEDVRELALVGFDRFPRIDILVNNAGVYGPLGPIEEIDWEEWARAVSINLLGSVITARAFLPHFKSNRYGKVIQLSGGGATSPLPRISAYAASKAAVVRFAETLAEEVREWKIDVNAIAPGALNTRLLDQVLDAGPDAVGGVFYHRSLKQKEEGGASLRTAAELAAFLASSESDGITGKLISAPWDPWRDFPAHAADLSATDVYTLRRIVPRDRGLDWGD